MTARALRRRARVRRRLLMVQRTRRGATPLVPAEMQGMRKPACTWHNWLAEESLYDGESRQLCPLWHHAEKESPAA